MLSEERHAKILKILEEKNSVTVTELAETLKISESTARRDITLLDRAGKLIKVFGGAIINDNVYLATEPSVAQKATVNREEKKQIAKYAASLIQAKDFVYLDAGTSIGYLIDFIEEKNARFMTNGVAHAQRLAAKGLEVILLGGTLKNSSEAVVGTLPALMLKNYHFTKGFFGANGVSASAGFTTHDDSEALVKKTAMEQCQKAYVICDHEKFHKIGPVTFATINGASILTDECPKEFLEIADVKLCK